jgi:hypothetical protein
MLKATALAQGWRVWQALADRCLSADQTTLRTWFAVPGSA